jgi:hypothetical protein
MATRAGQKETPITLCHENEPLNFCKLEALGQGLFPYARSTGSQGLIDLLQAHDRRDSKEPRYPIPPV